MTYEEIPQATLALVLFREARGEKLEAKIAVAYTALHRVAHPSWWGDDLQEVLTKKWQYSSVSDPHDPQLTTWPQMSDKSFRECWDAAQMALDKTATDVFPDSTHYYDISLPHTPPSWGPSPHFCGQLGRLKFFKVA